MALSNNVKITISLAVGLLVGAAVTNFLNAGTHIPGVAMSASAVDTQPTLKPRTPLQEVAQDIKKGGYILYFRHPQRQKWDSVIAFDVFELATGTNALDATFRDAVCLTPQGREESKMISKIFELAKVPVGAIIASPSCRARQGAELAFGHVDSTNMALAHTPVTNTGNAATFSAELKRVLSTISVEPGKNAIIFAHGNTLENNKSLFSSGEELLSAPSLQETGFFAIKRDADGKLHIVQRFLNLGDFAANSIDLQIVKP
jgi:phosphohistidine phosphatase SixA